MQHTIISSRMHRAVVFSILIGLSSITAVPTSQRIVGGSLATISQYPFASALLYSRNLVTYSQSCGGTILTNRAILTAAHCLYGDIPSQWQARVGSSWANTGGSVYLAERLIINSLYNHNTIDYDVAILRTQSAISYVNNMVQPATIAGGNYVLYDNQTVHAIGWGTTTVNGQGSEQLRQVQIWTVNQAVCRTRYSELGYSVTDNMLCSGWLDVGGRDQCQGDSGGPLIHNKVIVGICSWGFQCANSRYPGVNTRVSRFTSWIQQNA